MIIVNTLRAHKPEDTKQYRRAFGIQKWLVSKGFCFNSKAPSKVLKQDYVMLMKDYFLHIRPNHNIKDQIGMIGVEKLVQKDFKSFCSFCIRYFEKDMTRLRSQKIAFKND